MKSRLNGVGYALIDNSASDWGNKIESDVLSCGKCQAIIFVHSYVDHNGIGHLGWRDTGGHRCNCCDAPVCISCSSGLPCTPDCGGFKKAFDRQFDNVYQREQNAKILGI
jgi:hypothetical protein